MGMSAGQARLLSITARLTNNEFRAQTITNSKLRLADKSTEVSNEYMDALETKKLLFGTYSDYGDKTYTALTANQILTFADLKNQYSLINTAGKILLNGSDIKNYEASEYLYQFLNTYGVAKLDNPEYADKLTKIFGEDYAKIFNEDAFEQDYNAESQRIPNNIENLIKNTEDANLETLKNFLEMSNKDLFDGDVSSKIATIVQGWKNGMDSNLMNSYNIGNLVGRSAGNYLDILFDYPNASFPNPNDSAFYDISGNASLATTYSFASQKCYDNAQSNRRGCFMHVLAHLLLESYTSTDFSYINESSTYTGVTTTGKSVTIGSNMITGSAISYAGMSDDMVPVANEINKKDTDGNFVYHVPENNNDTTVADSSEKEKLLSNYKWVDSDSDGILDKELKSWTERIVDLYYACENYSSLGIDYQTELLPFLDKFQKEIANELTKEFNQERYDLAVNTWKNNLENWITNVENATKTFKSLFKDIPLRYVGDTTDSKYQWYVNLWDRMGAGKNDANGNRSTANYEELDPNLLNNQEWLEFALEHGVITMEQAVFKEDGSTKYSNKGTYDWDSIIYTNAVDIISQEDEVAIAVAEAKYKREMTEIENKDKEYDQDLKRLDTEHSALQTEYESIKGVIQKNVERSFKAFS